MEILNPTYMIITDSASQAALEQAVHIHSRSARGAVLTIPADGFRFRVINLETGEELPELSPEYCRELEQMMIAPPKQRGDNG